MHRTFTPGDGRLRRCCTAAPALDYLSDKTVAHAVSEDKRIRDDQHGYRRVAAVALIVPEDLTQSGAHVLIIGTSAYRHFPDGSDPTPRGELFGMEQLTSAASSASRFAAWMMSEYINTRAPLRSMRVLLSPNGYEPIHPDIAASLRDDYSTTLDNVKTEVVAFRKACAACKDNVAIVYIAGHGVQLTKTGAIVLLHDVGSEMHANLLEGALNVTGLHAGFNHPNTAQTQFWFVDACRQYLPVAAKFETLAGAFTLDEPHGSASQNPMFLATTTGAAAYAHVKGQTLFNQALLQGLRGRIATPPETGVSGNWHVSALELVRRLLPDVQALALTSSVEQTADHAGRMGNAVFHEYPQTPEVDLHVQISPAAARPQSRGSLRHGRLGMIVEHFKDWPLQQNVAAGLYEIKIDAGSGFRSYSDIVSFSPPVYATTISLDP